MKKRIFTVAICVSLLFCLSGCRLSITDDNGNEHAVNIEKEDVEKVKQGLEDGKNFIENIDPEKVKQGEDAIKGIYDKITK